MINIYQVIENVCSSFKDVSLICLAQLICPNRQHDSTVVGDGAKILLLFCFKLMTLVKLFPLNGILVGSCEENDLASNPTC